MKTTLILLPALFLSIQLQSQILSPELVASSGAYKDTLGISLSWSVGEPVSEFFKRDELILSQGFHHGKYLLNTIAEAPNLDFDIKLYPNPANDYIHIEIGTIQAKKVLEFFLYDFEFLRIISSFALLI